MFKSSYIPEILENILTHLSNPQIRYGPTYVCKARYSISLRALGDTAAIGSKDILPLSDTAATITTTSPSLFERQLLTTTRLKVHLKHDTSADSSHASQILTTAIQNIPSETQQQIRTLYYLNEAQGLFRHFSPETLRPLRQLTELHIMANTHRCYNLDELFLTLPNLKAFFLGQILQFTIHGQTRLTRSDWEAPFPISVGKLLSLTLQVVQLDRSLDQLLTQCLKLKEIKLEAVEYFIPPRTDVGQTQPLPQPQSISLQ
ncbi:hypothetical protein BGX34_001186 [Mortierella sp. NVP85]|nr:hypothetical protein BGX34_001186 [Mortierella sp. NVP85]